MCCFIERTVRTNGPWKPLPPPGSGDFTASQPSLGATGPVIALIRGCTTGAAVPPARTSVHLSVRLPVHALIPICPSAHVSLRPAVPPYPNPTLRPSVRHTSPSVRPSICRLSTFPPSPSTPHTAILRPRISPNFPPSIPSAGLFLSIPFFTTKPSTAS